MGPSIDNGFEVILFGKAQFFIEVTSNFSKGFFSLCLNLSDEIWTIPNLRILSPDKVKI